MSFDNIPNYVKDNTEFCYWRFETVKNKQTKVPNNPRTGRRGSVSGLFITALASLTHRLLHPPQNKNNRHSR